MIHLLEPFTKTMLAQLRRGRAIELSQSERSICFEDDFKGSLAGLCKRGFLDRKMVVLNGKKHLVYILLRQVNFFR